MSEIVLTNARIVTPGAVVDGTIVLHDGMIAEVSEGASATPGALDMEGDYLLPGLVELHTDNLERHLTPRPGVHWPVAGALQAHDAAMIAAGITTVFDALSIGDIIGSSPRITYLGEMVGALTDGAQRGALRAHHLLHLRCELTYEEVVERFSQLAIDPLVRLASLMDHTPGQRQFADLAKHRQYYQGKYGMDEATLAAFMERQMTAHQRFSAAHRQELVDICQERGIALASHDDETVDHVEQASAEGVCIAEFPTTLVAAHAARERGLSVLMGGPNLVLGGSQSGNISARDLAADRLLDVISSDYVPASMLAAAFALPANVSGIELPQAVAMVSANPARLVGLHDRGAIAVGLRGDLIRVAGDTADPGVRGVWRDGDRVF